MSSSKVHPTKVRPLKESIKQFKLGLNWDLPESYKEEDMLDLDVSVLLLDKDGKELGICYHKKTNALEGAVVLIRTSRRGGNNRYGLDLDDETIEINLDKMPEDVYYIVPCITVYSPKDEHGKATKHFNDVTGANCKLYAENVSSATSEKEKSLSQKKAYYSLDLSNYGDGVFNGCIMCIIQRTTKYWAYKRLGYYT